MLKENKLELLKQKAKNTPCSMVGVDITKLNLDNEEKHQLIKEGFSISPTRYNKTILTYSQAARAKDFRNRVLNKIKKGDFKK